MPTDATKNRMDALAAVAGFAATVAMAICGYVVHQFDNRLEQLGDSLAARVERVESRCRENELLVVRAAEHVAQHDKAAAIHIRNIGDNIKRSRSNERRLDRLETKPAARADPFTGADGRRLEQMINALRKQTH